MGHLVAVDLETSGLNPFVHEIIEVGLVWKAPPDAPIDYLRRMEFVLSFDESKADPKALEVNGWGKREFGPVVDRGWALEFLAELLDDAHLVGKNPGNFDAQFLRSFFIREGWAWGEKPTWHHRMIDVGTLVQGRFRLPDPPDTASVEELTNVRIPENKRHSALADAQWAWDVYEWVVKS